MTHEDAGHYAAKHAGAHVNPAIALRIKKQIKRGCISCTSAHKAARDLQATPREVGITIDLLEARIVQCQLGLFGAAPQRAAAAHASVPAALQQAIATQLGSGRLPCSAAWNIAESFKMPKGVIKDACDSLNIKICSCQLGAFK